MSFLLTTSWNKLEEIIAWMLAEQGILLPYLQRIIFAAYQDWWEPIIIETKFCLNLLLGEKHKQLNKNQLSIISDEMQIITFFVVWTCLWSGISIVSEVVSVIIIPHHYQPKYQLKCLFSSTDLPIFHHCIALLYSSLHRPTD